jgi:hypothetical protein
MVILKEARHKFWRVKMQSTMSKADLDNATSGVPGAENDLHGVLYLHGACHLKAPQMIRYEKESGELVICCAECGSDFVRIRL